MVMNGTTEGQLDIQSAFGSGLPLVRCTPTLVEASSGQKWYYFRSADLWSDIPPTLAEVSSGQEWYYFRSG